MQFGQLGLGHNDDAHSPQIVSSLSERRVHQLATGWKHTLAVTDDGKFWAWGRGVNGQLGCGNAIDVNKPQEIRISSSELAREAHPIIMYSVPPSDRYAIVPDNDMAQELEEKAHAVPQAEGEGGSKRLKTS